MRHRSPVVATSAAIALVLAVFLARPSAASAAEPSFTLPVEHHRLANGMEVVLAPDPALADVSVLVRYRVGSADDPPGKEGLAHVAEHMMFAGSKHVAAGEHVRMLEDAGGTNIEGSTGIDRTTFSETIPPGRLPLALWLESDRMGLVGAPLDTTSVEGEWKAADAEEDETHRTGAGTAGYEALWGEIFPVGHPYHRSRSNRIGLGVFGAADVRAFLRSWYSPANATLILAGHFESGATLALVEKYFAPIDAPAPPPDRPPAPADWAVPDVRLDVVASVARELVSFAWRAPPLETPGDLALDLAASILNERKGRLERELVDHGLATWVGASEQSFLEGSMFRITASIARGSDPEATLRAITHAVSDLGSTLTPAEVALASRLRRDALLGSVQTSAKRTGRLVSGGGDLSVDKYAAIDAEAIRRVVRETLIPSHRVVMVVHHEPKSPWFGVVVHREEHPAP
jgi:zinc protease